MATVPTQIEVRQLGFANETTRGTAVNPSKWLAITPDSEIEFVMKPLEDPALRGTLGRYADIAGPQVATGKIKCPFRPKNAGDFFYMLLGQSTDALIDASTAYLHTMTPTLATILQPPAYTFTLYRSLDTKKYNNGVVNKIDISCKKDGLVEMEADIYALNEAAGAIGTASFIEQVALKFYDVSVYVGAPGPTFPLSVASLNPVMDFKISMDNGAKPFMPLVGTQYPKDIISNGLFKVTGEMTIIFEDETERANFIAATAASYEFDIKSSTKVVGETGAYYYRLDLRFGWVNYKAYPYGDVEGYLGAKVKWEAKYDTTNTKIMQALITNEVAAYP